MKSPPSFSDPTKTCKDTGQARGRWEASPDRGTPPPPLGCGHAHTTLARSPTKPTQAAPATPPPSTPAPPAPNTTLTSAGSQASSAPPAPASARTTGGRSAPLSNKVNPTGQVASQFAPFFGGLYLPEGHGRPVRDLQHDRVEAEHVPRPVACRLCRGTRFKALARCFISRVRFPLLLRCGVLTVYRFEHWADPADRQHGFITW